MTDTKFTRGPWTPYCCDVTSTDRPIGDDGVRFWDITPEGPYRGHVAHVHSSVYIGGITLEQRDANARLIAASPALYEALEEFVREYEGFEDGNGEPCPTRQKAIAALAAARGDAS